MTLIKCFNWDKYYLFTLDLPAPFPVGTTFPYDGKLYIVVEHGYEYVSPDENDKQIQLADLVLIIDSIRDSSGTETTDKRK